MPVAACFSLAYFPRQAFWRAVFSLIPEIPVQERVPFLKQMSKEKQKGSVVVTSSSLNWEILPDKQ